MYATYKKVELSETNELVGTGWIPPMPDLRDYSAEHPDIVKIAKKLGIAAAGTKAASAPSLPAKIDLRQWCSPIENQGGLGSCSAHAGMRVVEYFERRAFGKHIDGSRLFLYKATRDLMGWVDSNQFGI